MKHSTRSFKFAPLMVLVSGLCTSCTISDYLPHDKPRENIDVAAANQEIEQQKQLKAEAKISEIVGNHELQFKSAVAKIYADNEYGKLWTDANAEKQFLREYAAMVASGVSLRSARALDAISAVEDSKESIAHDVLLTDAFLDYMYYNQNVAASAQGWLYAVNSYKARLPEQAQIDEWLSAVKNNQSLAFVKSLSKENSLYHQTIDHIASSLNGAGKSSAIDLAKLAINAQRLRVIPDFNNGLFVNIPSYQLNYYRDGRLVLNSRAIVGKNERRTPVMASKLSNVVVNPPWNAPTRLINEDIVPKVKRDPGYLERNGYSILDGKGNAVNPYNINWDSIGKRFPYRIRQAAGDHSALGRFKFNMPSSDAIYLHDTPNHALFNKKDRALSSGCVRVDKSDELATILLQEAGWSIDKKQSVLASKKTTSVPIRSNNPVYLYYVTIWVENGKVHTLPDIYGYDTAFNANFVNWNTVRKYL
ncbi:L,D-transpeptidase-like protein [Pasteurella langaaensis DSM 22999]|uniref:L,D-transpeptidase-like protein n=2 Tax=Alitibacter langaaensis TaxID=756 RepID=A0A2U0TA56_9PAST|nr:L,D-transpeptidase family protein [Pasteurella langaaensis]PVX40496.1 L,D-transpeptidase-like protein [Pasteurella langaaensis DSM 22999]